MHEPTSEGPGKIIIKAKFVLPFFFSHPALTFPSSKVFFYFYPQALSIFRSKDGPGNNLVTSVQRY